jgi:hypothetical protein
MNLQIVAEMLRIRYHATVDANPDYLEVETITPIPGNLLRIDIR